MELQLGIPETLSALPTRRPFSEDGERVSEASAGSGLIREKEH